MRNKSLTIWVVVMSVCLGVVPAFGWTQFKDGWTHDITTTINDDVWVDYQAPGMETTVNWLGGGAMPFGYELHGYNDSHINMFGGSIGGYLRSYDNSHVNVSGGSIYQLWTYDNSQVNVSGGSIGHNLWAYDNSQVNVSGGSIGNRLWTYDNSQVDFSGGLVNGELVTEYSSELTIHGSDFAVDGQLFGFGELASILGGHYGNEPSRRLTGTLSNGDPLDNEFYIGDDAKIVLTPEPTTLLLLGLGALMSRRKR